MKKFFRFAGLLSVIAFLGACVSPYQAEMSALHNAYRSGNVSDYDYRQQMTQLQMRDAGWQQSNANTAAAVGIAAVGAAVLLNNNDHHHHHGRWHEGHWHQGHWHSGGWR